MDSKPLGYDPLKIILQYMGANKRFEISQRIPYTQTADRVTPLFIDKLVFDGHMLTVNNVEYTLGTFIDNHLFLEISSPETSTKEFFSYTKKLPEAMKYLNTKFFGNRKHPIKVRRLMNAANNETIRLPVNLKMEVEELIVGEMPEALQLLPVIQNSKVGVFRIEVVEEPDFEMEILKTARSIIIGCVSLLNWLPYAQNLVNKQVLLMDTEYIDFPNNHALLIRHWIDNGKEVGTCFSFGFEKRRAEQVLRMVVEQFGGLEIKMKNGCRLVVSLEEMSFDEEEDVFDESWKVDMKVVDKYNDSF